MPELRKDPVVGRWVIISSERGRRPSDFNGTPDAASGKPCPFCVGNEDKTPPEVLAYRTPGSAANTPGWTTRVVPNKFPALQIEGGLDRRGEGLYDKMNGIGAHEVIIETTDHTKELSELSLEQIENVLWAFRDRIVDLKNDDRFRYILIFKNHGASAGASLEHSHTQLIATPIIPKVVTEELDGSLQHYRLKERCVFCDMIEQEIREEKRVVFENEHFISFGPFAPRFPFETWILPRSHVSAFEDSQKNEFASLAQSLKETLGRINKALNRPPYNFIVHSAPCRDTRLDHYHWHIEIMPKLTKVAGFEWGTGFYINPTSPEEAAQYLREIQL
ncbi:MAG: galactose-1-phosphate uridylyltransferase [Candidatus Latescibacteria bacterium]|nr:galactose-1-phosphate uridylyltransferase [Candidatus Latescibacterota bacterium]